LTAESNRKRAEGFGLYVHWPFCLSKCPYCDFNSHEARGAPPEERYIAALIADLDRALPQVWGRRVYSVFFGGGTPSLFSAGGIDAILSAVRARVPLAADAEITLEANPGTFEISKFAAYRSAGVNRLSIGIQSFNPGHLSALGRIHDDHEAHRAIEIARANFDNFNLDLMHGLPEQSLDDALGDLRIAIAGFDPDQRQQPAIDRTDTSASDFDLCLADALDQREHRCLSLRRSRQS